MKQFTPLCIVESEKKFEDSLLKTQMFKVKSYYRLI